MALAFVAFYLFTVVWVAIVHANADDTKLPDELGVDRSTAALLAAPPCSSRSSRRSPRSSSSAASSSRRCATGRACGRRRSSPAWSSASIHVGSAEAALLLPLAFFGFALCLLRERTGSLFPCIVAALGQQLAGLRRLAALELADTAALRVRAGAHRERGCARAGEVVARARRCRLSALRVAFAARRADGSEGPGSLARADPSRAECRLRKPQADELDTRRVRAVCLPRYISAP